MSLDDEQMNAFQMGFGGISPQENEDDIPEDDDEDDDFDNEDGEHLASNHTRMEIGGKIVIFPQRHVNERHSEILEGCLFNLRQRNHSFVECLSDQERRLSLLTSILANYQYQIRGENDQAEMQQVPGNGGGLSSISSAFSSKSKIYFACRSLEEISQVIQDLKSFKDIGYLENLTMAVLAHPTQLCYHCDDNVITCLLPPTSEAGYNFIEANGTVHDLKHLKKRGRSAKFCAYHFNKEFSKQADLVICLQQFILSSTNRTKYCINPENSIFIFDDGGNIENACYAVASLSMRTTDFKAAGKMMEEIHKSFEENQSPEVKEVAGALLRLAANLNGLPGVIDTQAGGTLPNSAKLLEILGERGFSKLAVQKSIVLLCQAMSLIESIEEVKRAVQEKIPWGMSMFLKIEQFLTALTYVYSSVSKKALKDFGLQITKGTKGFPNSFQISYANAYAVMEPIINAKTSIVFISSPCLPSVSILREQLSFTGNDQENRRHFDENFDVIVSSQDHTQCFFGFTSMGPNGVKIELNHQNKGRETVLAENGEAILTICQKIKNGIIVSFASKPVLEDHVKRWKDGEKRPVPIWDELKKVKHIFCELDFMKAEDARRQLQLFRDYCRSPFGDRNGAILLSLHREQVSKLMEFEAGEVRAFVSAGIPYHSDFVFNIKTKKEQICERSGESVYRKYWYNAEAFYNQNVKFAHCARKEQDWVVGVILDSRMEVKVKGKDTEFLLPKWMQGHWKGYKDFTEMTDEMERFLEDK